MQYDDSSPGVIFDTNRGSAAQSREFAVNKRELPSLLFPYTMLPHLLAFIAALAGVRAVCWHDGNAAPSPSFGYSLERGPVTWAGIPPARDWTTCRIGQHQSPVVIYTRSAQRVPPNALNISLSDVVAGGAKLENLGTTLEVPAERKTKGKPRGLLVYRKGYVLQQFHFHTPSEHRINDEHYPLEMHLVFSNAVRCHIPLRSRGPDAGSRCTEGRARGDRRPLPAYERPPADN